ncbi:TetR/AcrR family transcriptional regulator [Geoalkalibacter halelectricus]|uniref:TetR/AcrR family transcriptional regulator n=1 Tax=Geoalkalibacter halelectricus TaxID=2847045 RepID=UPI003D225BFC
MNHPDTKQRLLDAAEQLFARDGFHSTSLRAITRAAGVNLAAVSYHFGGKEALVEAVFERRLAPLNAARRQRLDAVRDSARTQGRAPTIEEVLRAFIEPTLALREAGPGACAFISLVGRALNEPNGVVRTTFMRHMQPLFTYLFELTRSALPTLNTNSAFWRLLFALSTTAHAICLSDQSLPWPPGVAPLRDSEALLAEILPFVTAAMEAQA